MGAERSLVFVCRNLIVANCEALQNNDEFSKLKLEICFTWILLKRALTFFVQSVGFKLDNNRILRLFTYAFGIWNACSPTRGICLSIAYGIIAINTAPAANTKHIRNIPSSLL